MTTEPVQLLIDTGSPIYLVSKDKIKKDQRIKKPIYHITGVTGPGSSFSTGGSIIGNFLTDDNNDWLAEIHIVDRENAGPYDSYLGLDFLRKYEATIDLHTGILTLHAPNKKVTFNDEVDIINPDRLSNSITLNESATIDREAVETRRNENPTELKCDELNREEIAGSMETRRNESPLEPNSNELSRKEKTVLKILKKLGNEEETKVIRLICSTSSNEHPNIKITQCHFDNINESCRKCLSNRNKLMQTKMFPDETFFDQGNATPQTLENPLEDTNDTQSYLKKLNEMKIGDYDDEITKLKKISMHKLRLPTQVINYIKYFGATNVPTKNLYSMKFHEEMSRQEYIIENIPTKHCSEQEKDDIIKFIEEFSFQFYVEGDALSKTDIIQHHIHLKPDAPIINVRQFRLSEKMKGEVINETRELEAQEIIRPSVSPYNSPAFMVGKKDEFGGMTDNRFVINFRKINEYNLIQDFPIPKVEELIDGFSKCKYFSTLDIKSAFHQIELYPPHRQYTAFTAGFLKYEWNRMPFGLCSAPHTMQEAVTVLLRDLLGNGVHVYIDDVSIATEKRDDHDRLLKEVFTRLKKHNFQVKIKKCYFYAKQIEFLGFIVTPGQVRPNPNKIEALMKISEPKNRKQVQQFLGMANYYRRFIRNYSHISRPLTKQTSIKNKFTFDDDCKEAFLTIKSKLAGNVMLQIVDYAERFYVSCDASDKAIGAVLAQGRYPNDRPIQFFSQALNEQQAKWKIIERECLALVSAVKAFRPYLHGREFTLITDNLALVYLAKFNDPHSKILRMKMELMSFRYTIIHRPGSQNRVADALSRLDSDEEMNLEDFIKRNSPEIKTKAIRAITRSKSAGLVRNALQNVEHIPVITCEPNMVTENSEYQAIFSVISVSNQDLILKLSGDEDITETRYVVEVRDDFYLATLNNPTFCQRELTDVVNDIIRICQMRGYLSIAINTDLKAKYLFIMKYLLNEKYGEAYIDITIHTNQILELTDPREIENALKMHHSTRLGGHCGIQRMIKTMKRIYTWHNMVTDIKKYVNSCAICEKAKTNQKTRAPLQITSSGEKAFDHVFIDYMGPVAPSENGHK